MIGGLRPQLDLTIAHWPRHSYTLWEAEWLMLLKIEQGLGIVQLISRWQQG